MNTVTTMNTATVSFDASLTATKKEWQIAKPASMSLVVDNTKPLTMSTLQIAQMMNRVDRHRDIKRTVDRLVASGVIVHTPTAREQLEDKFGRSREIEVYLLDERSSYIVVAQISPEFTAFIVDEWKRLKEENEKLRSTPVNPYENFEETDWIELALEKTRENKRLVELHVRKAIDTHSLTRLLGEKRGSVKVQMILKGLCAAGVLERRLDASGKPNGYDLLPPGYMFARMSAHGQIEFTADAIPHLVKLGLLEEEKAATLKLPQPNNSRAIVNNTALLIRQNAGSLEHFGL
ncbi:MULTISPECIES: Rha family transcriptional regulator [Escherichia]|uniref:Rha family transcriptional regulator n=1 Tax=Escherichia TaxID=561 RepID=UPI001E5BC60E|nr:MULTISPECIES: Rha family transcriptional regulator [Escherichia]MCD6952692.1 Rha family transcriptional regulator [Escherichia coli]